MAHQVRHVVLRFVTVVLPHTGQLEGNRHLVMVLHSRHDVQLAALYGNTTCGESE
jgi:hypothetical protein